MKKIIIGIVIILLVILSYVLYVSDFGKSKLPQQPGTTVNQETTGWEIYQNEKHGLSFKYPAEWPKPIEKDLGTIVSLQFEKRFYVEYGTYITKSTGSVVTLEEIISIPNKIIKVGNKEVIRIEDSKYDQPIHLAYIKGNDSKILKIEDGGGLISAEDFDNLISSFEFTFN